MARRDHLGRRAALESLIRHGYPDAALCAAGLADALAETLDRLLSIKPRLTLALSGGRSPREVLPLLAAKPIDWSRVDVTLVDERRVPADHADSNAGLVQQWFLDKGAAAARFTPLWTETMPLADALSDTSRRLAPVLPTDIAYLGMGPDGHIASLFPAASVTAYEYADGPVIATKAPAEPAPRISLTLSTILKIPHLYLHVTGSEKAHVLAETSENPPTPAVPVSLLVHARPDLQVFTCP